jgi:hypothetical protein
MRPPCTSSRRSSPKRKPAKRKRARAKEVAKKKRSPAKKVAKKKRSPARKSAKDKRSDAAKKGWAKRRKRTKLIEAMDALNFREIELPTRDELYDYLLWASKRFDIEISDLYRMYFGYGVGDVTPEVWEH